MKNITLFLLLAGFCLLSFVVSAQPRPAIKAGLNYGGLSGYDGGKKTGIHAGFSMQWTVNKKWTVQPELLYSSTGQQYSAEEAEVLVTKTLPVSYAGLPVMVQYHSGSKFYLEAGPQLSFLLTAKDKGSAADKADVRRNLSNTQFGLNLGTGMQISSRTGFYVRYSFGPLSTGRIFISTEVESGFYE